MSALREVGGVVIVSERTILATVIGIAALVLTAWSASATVIWTMVGTSLFWVLVIWAAFYSKPRKRRRDGDETSL